jgi:predicted SAM-dependent methyltransferase
VPISLKKTIVLYSMSMVKKFTASWEIDAYLSLLGQKKINVGAQTNIIPGWLNVDVLPFPGATYMNATKHWPFKDSTFDLILCEHMIEHVTKKEGQVALDEAFRVASKGARLRIVTPDLQSFAHIALDPEAPKLKPYIHFIQSRHPSVTPHDIVNMIFYDYGHRHIYSPGELSRMLRKSGFVDIQESRGGYPIDSAFDGSEGHPKLLGLEPNAIEAFALEARKP